MRTRARPTTKADETPEFLLFWETWRPVMAEFDGRGAARTEFLRHVEEYGVDPMDMVDGAKWFVRNGGNTNVDRNGKPVRIHAASWLNKYAYEDGCEQEREFQRKVAEMRARKAENVVQLRASAPDPIDNEARRRHAAAVMARAGYAPSEAQQEQKKA